MASRDVTESYWMSNLLYWAHNVTLKNSDNTHSCNRPLTISMRYMFGTKSKYFKLEVTDNMNRNHDTMGLNG